MIKQAFTLTLLFTSFSFLVAQTDCKIDSKYTIEKENITEKDILEVLNSTSSKPAKERFYNEGVNDLRKEAENCNAQIANEIDIINRKYKRLSALRQDLITSDDYKKIQDQLKQKDEQRKSIKKNLITSLEKIGTRAIYCVLIKDIENIFNIDHAQLNDLASTPLQFRATEDYIGYFINSSTSTFDFFKTEEKIEAYTNASCEAMKVESKTNFSKNYHLYYVDYLITPDQKKRETTQSLEKNNNLLIINLEKSNDYEIQLQKNGVISQDIEEVKRFVDTYKRFVIEDNKKAQTERDEVFNAARLQLQQIKQEEEKLFAQIQERSQKIENVCKDLNITYEKNDVEKSASQAATAIDKEICKLNTEWSQSKEKELLFLITPNKFVIEYRPIDDIAKKALELYNKIQNNYNRITNVEIFCRIENAVMKDYRESYEHEIYRTIEKIWIFPIPEDDGFKVAVFAKFKITNKQLSQPVIPLTSFAPKTPDQPTVTKSNPGKIKSNTSKTRKSFFAAIFKPVGQGLGAIGRGVGDFVSNSNGAKLNFFYNKNYYSFDLGASIVNDNSYDYFDYNALGLSIGGYFGNEVENAGGVLFRGNYERNIRLLRFGIDTKIGIGAHPFFSAQPKIGISVLFIYFDLGHEFATLGSGITFNTGFNFYSLFFD